MIDNPSMRMDFDKDRYLVKLKFEYSETLFKTSEISNEITIDVFSHTSIIIRELNDQNIKYTKVEISNIIDKFDTFDKKVFVNIFLEPYSFPIFLMKYHGK